jgi:hypothetical protein
MLSTTEQTYKTRYKLVTHEDVRSASIQYILENNYYLRYCPEKLKCVIWGTVYRYEECLCVYETIDADPFSIAKVSLIDGGPFLSQLKRRSLDVKFMNDVIFGTSRGSTSEQAANIQLLEDCLMWRIVDAASMTWTERCQAREKAVAPYAYMMPIPSEVVQ